MAVVVLVFFCGGRGLLSNYVFIHIAPLYKGSPMVASFFLRGKFEDDLLFFPQDKQYHDDFFFWQGNVIFFSRCFRCLTWLVCLNRWLGKRLGGSAWFVPSEAVKLGESSVPVRSKKVEAR